jgi:glycosyltransferase involved in cell wall biosynthesis
MEKEHPFFSIIVPTYNRQRKLTACLKSIAFLDYPNNRFEVIVVDDGGKTSLDDVISLFQKQINLTLLTQSHRGPASARNTGASRANGSFLAFTDDDCQLAPNWLRNFAAHFTTLPDHAIGGRTLNALPDNLYSTASQLVINYLYTYYNSDPHHACFLTSNNLALPADRFHTVGGFNTTFPQAAGEDREFCNRWLHHGYRLIYAQDVIIYHAHDLSFRTFWRQHFNYGGGAYRYHQARAKRGTGRFRPDPKFYMRLILSPLIQERGKRALVLTALMMISQIANAIGFFGKDSKNQKEISVGKG